MNSVWNTTPAKPGQTPRGQKRKSGVLNTPVPKVNTPAKPINTPGKGKKPNTPNQKKKVMTPIKIEEEEEEEDEEEETVDVKMEQESDDEEADDQSDVEDEEADDQSDVENEEGEEEDDDDEDDEEEDEEEEDDDDDAEEEDVAAEVEVEKQQQPKRQRVDKDNSAVIMIKNLLWLTSRRDLSQHFSQHGKISAMWFKYISVLAPLDRTEKGAKKEGRLPTMRARCGHFFIRYENRESAEKAVAAENSKVFQGRHMSVELLVNSVKIEKCYDANLTIYVGNISSLAEDEDLWTLFRSCGEVVNVRMLRNFSSRFLKQYAFVTFKTAKGFEAGLKMGEQDFAGYRLNITKYGNMEHNKNIKSENKEPKVPQEKKFSPIKTAGPPTETAGPPMKKRKRGKKSKAK